MFLLSPFFSSAWYRGLFPVVSSLCCSNFVYFYSYNGLKAVCLAEGSKGEPAKELLLAFVAGKFFFFYLISVLRCNQDCFT